jgi:hypothetical protein
MFIAKAAEVCWTPIFLPQGRRAGLNLAPKTALWCRQTVRDDRREIVRSVWNAAGVGCLEPSGWIAFYEETMLPVALYHRHGGGNGDWLSCEASDIESLNETRALTYSYHHTEPRDDRINRQLEFMFSCYMSAMLVLSDQL